MRIIFLFFICLLCQDAFSQEKKRLHIYGNQIYDDNTILKIAGIDFENPPPLAEMKQKLETTGYFSSVKVSDRENHLVIVVKEKSPWFVLPYFMSDAETKIYGIAGGIVGLGGSHTKLLARMHTGAYNKAASFMYRDDFFLNSFFIVGYTLDYENAKHDIYNDREIISRTHNKAMNNTLHTGYHLRPDLIVQTDVHIEKHEYAEPSGANARGTQVSQRFFIEYGNLYLNEGLAKGFWIKPYIETAGLFGNYHFYQMGIFSQASIINRGDFNWIFKPRAEFGRPLPYYQKFELGGSKLRSFPSQSFRAQTYGAVQNDFLITSWNIWKVKLRPMVYADWAYIQNGGRTGLGAGLQLYFRNVAVPAIQIHAGYGFHPDGFSMIASIGPQI